MDRILGLIIVATFLVVDVSGASICGDILHTAEVTTNHYTHKNVPANWTMCYIDHLDVAHIDTACRDLVVNVAYGAFKTSADILAAGGTYGCWFGTSNQANRGPAFVANGMIPAACRMQVLQPGRLQHDASIRSSAWFKYSNVTLGVCIRIPDVDECTNNLWNNCHENASCHNTIGSFGSFMCQCNIGYQGNGKVCTVEHVDTDQGSCESVTENDCAAIAKARKVKMIEIRNPDLDRFPRGCYYKSTNNRIYFNTKNSKKECTWKRICICKKVTNNE